MEKAKHFGADSASTCVTSRQSTEESRRQDYVWKTSTARTFLAIYASFVTRAASPETSALSSDVSGKWPAGQRRLDAGSTEHLDKATSVVGQGTAAISGRVTESASLRRKLAR